MANLNLNKVIMAGRLTADPELRTTPSGVPVTRFTVAISRPKTKDGVEQKADFISTIAWRTTAEFITKYFRKGSSICIVGSIQTSDWTDQNGQKRYSTEVLATEAMFVDSKSETGGQYTPDPAYAAPPTFASTPGATPKFEELKTDEDLPF